LLAEALTMVSLVPPKVR